MSERSVAEIIGMNMRRRHQAMTGNGPIWRCVECGAYGTDDELARWECMAAPCPTANVDDMLTWLRTRTATRMTIDIACGGPNSYVVVWPDDHEAPLTVRGDTLLAALEAAVRAVEATA